MSPGGKLISARQQPVPGTVLPPLPEVAGEGLTDQILENPETDDELEGPNRAVAGTDLADATAPWSTLSSPLTSARGRSNLLVGVGPCWAGGLPEVEALPQPLAYAPPILCGLCCHCPPKAGDLEAGTAEGGSSSSSSSVVKEQRYYDESLLLDYLDFMAGAPGLLPQRPTSAGYPGEPPLVQGVRAHARSRQIMDLQDEAHRNAARGLLSEAGRCLTEALEARAGNMGPQDEEVLFMATEKATAVLNNWACRALSWAAAASASSYSACCPPSSSSYSSNFPLAASGTSSRFGAPVSAASLSALGICAVPFPPLASSGSQNSNQNSIPNPNFSLNQQGGGAPGQGAGQSAAAFELLKQAEALEVRLQIRLPGGARARCRALTFHHFAVYYRLRSKLSAALSYAAKSEMLAQRARLPSHSLVPIGMNHVALLISNGRSKQAAELCESLLQVLSKRPAPRASHEESQEARPPLPPPLSAPLPPPPQEPQLQQQQQQQQLAERQLPYQSQMLDDATPEVDALAPPDPAEEAFAPGSVRHMVFYVLALYNTWVANWRLGSRKSVDKMLRADHFVHRHLGPEHSLAARVHQAVELSMAVRDRTSSSVSSFSSFSSPRGGKGQSQGLGQPLKQPEQHQLNQLQQFPNITDRGPWQGRTILQPTVPASERVPLHRKLKQMSVKESVYGRRRHHFAEGASSLQPLGRPATGRAEDHGPMVGSPRAI